MTTAHSPSLLTPRVLIPFIIVTLIWGSTWIVIRDQLGSVPPSWSVTYRFALAAVGMFMLTAIRREPLLLSGRAWGFAALLGTLQFALNFNFVYRAEGYVTSGVVAIIFALLIVPNTLLSRMFLKTSFDRRFLAGSAIALVGIALLLLHEARSVRGDAVAVLLGFALTLSGVMSASFGNIMQASRFARSQPASAVLAWAMLFGSAADGLFAALTVGAPVIDMRPAYLAGVAYLGIIGTVCTFPLYFRIVRDVGAGPAAWSSVLIPIVAMTLSTFGEGYSWSPLAIGGAMLAITGLIVALRR
ncbi:MAG: EamA family transporter [Sphingopyxis sp.]